MPKNVVPLYKILGHAFKNPQLLEIALTHRSYGKQSYERFEFLGDAILNFIVGEALYQKYSTITEGELSRLRAYWVNQATLASIAKEFDIAAYLRLGTGEEKAGGRSRESILADVIEAIIGAIYLDAGLETCQRCVMHWYAKRLEETTLAAAIKDPKTRLQEYLQAQQLDLPIYKIISVAGKQHAQIFHLSCELKTLGLMADGRSHSRRKAEQIIAQKLLDQLGQESS